MLTSGFIGPLRRLNKEWKQLRRRLDKLMMMKRFFQNGRLFPVILLVAFAIFPAVAARGMGASAAGGAGAQAKHAKKPNGPKMRFDFHLKVGDSATFAQGAHLTMNGMPISMSNREVQTLIKILPNGNQVIRADDINIVVKAGSNPVPTAATQTSKVTSKPSGEIVNIDSSQVSAQGYRLADITNFIHPLSGASSHWKITVPANPTTGAAKYVAEYTVIKEVKINGFDAYKIDFSIHELGISDPASGTGTMWIGKKSGWLDKLDVTLHNPPFPGSDAHDAILTSERIKN